jgi:hypothetical protein
MAQERSGWAVGWTMFAAFMLIMVGVWKAIAGLAALFDDETYVFGQLGDGYFLKLDPTQWGWIHLILGIVLALAGFGLFTGAVWARTVGVIAAVVSAIGTFAWLTWYPVWGILIIAVDVAVIWALTAHGRDITDMS